MLKPLRVLAARWGKVVPLPARATARRALPAADTADDEQRSWLTTAIAGVAITVLGLAVAGSVSITGAAVSDKDSRPAIEQSIAPGVRQPDDFARRGAATSRDADREALEKRLLETQSAEEKVAQQQLDAALSERSSTLTEDAEQAAKTAKKRKEQGVTNFPVQNYTLTGRWGDVGPWAKYHTGLDMAAPLGTQVSAPASGVVTFAGTGGTAGSWAGSYVVIQHQDGKSTLYAHLSPSLQVNVGDKVSGGTPLGQVGMTGRTFGAHLHFELYPAGATPGDIYSSEDPLPWLMRAG